MNVNMPDPKCKPAPLAYQNEPFLNSPEGRILRILSEYSEPLSRFRREQIQDTVVFFGSARFYSKLDAQKRLTGIEAAAGERANAEQNLQLKQAVASLDMARYYEDARRLAFLLTKWSIQIPARRRRFVVTTGGGPGIMEAANHSISNSITSSCGNSGLPISPRPW
jgi:predicted Rossmann-fold nucleotide-binding protein